MASNGTASTSFLSSRSPSSPTESSIAPTPSSPSTPSAASQTPTPSLTVPSSSANPPTSQQPSSTPVSLPPSSSPAPSSNAPSSTPPPSSSPPPQTSVVTVSSRPPSTQIITSVVTPSATSPGETPNPSTVVVTSVISASNQAQPSNVPATASGATTSTAPASLQSPNSKNGAGGLTSGGRTAIAVVIPVVAVALLVIGGLFLWKKRKQRKTAEEARRKEVEEYGFNPNNDPTLPAVGAGGSEMAEDQSGYRGWGNTSSTNRKASTTLSSGMNGYSDNGSNPGGYQSPGSPTQVSEGHSGDPLMNGRRETLDSEGIGALGAGPAANQNRSDIHRGPSNASSSYSAANRSDNSGEYPMPMNNPQELYPESGYYQPGPYGEGAFNGNQQPVIRDVSARRNTRIENPSVFPHQGNSGIAQNF